MKRKFKLFATIASLCLSLALMAFGVYAATTINYTATGSVSYDLDSDVWCSFSADVEHMDYKTAVIADVAGAAAAYGADGVQDLNLTDPDDVTVTGTNATEVATQTLPAIDFNNGYVAKITITVKRTNGSSPATVTPSVGTVNGSNYAVSLATGEAAEELPVAANSTVDFVFYVYLTNNTVVIEEVTYQLKIDVAAHA